MNQTPAHSPNSPDPTPAMTVTLMRQQLSAVAARLAAAALKAREIDQWSQRLPERHVPYKEPVTVTDLVTTATPDPGALESHVQRLAELAELVQATLGALDGVVTTQTGPFSPAAIGHDDAEFEQQIEVTARLGSRFGDDETFERQRQAVRQVLSFDGPSATWYGPLPCRMNADLPRWQALAEAAAAGAEIRLNPL